MPGEASHLVAETATRILADFADPQTVNRDASGSWKAKLWEALDAAGLPLAWVPEALGGSGAGKVALHALPAGASLTLDGAPLKLSAGQAVSLPAGPHRIEMTTPHGRTVRAFTVLPDTTSELVLQETPSGDARSGVLAPAENYLPTNAFSVEGKKIVVRYAGHVVVAYFGESAVRYDGATADFDSMPQTIGGKLFLPLALLEKLTDDTSKDR